MEGLLILVAGGAIAAAAVERLLRPVPLENVGLSLGIALVATAINGGVGLILRRAGRRLRSITLQADAQHLLTDVWTTGGVLIGVLLVQLTGWLVLDSVVALLVAANITWTAWRLIRATALGLLDTALPTADQATIRVMLARYERQGTGFHALRTRSSGVRRFMSVHVLVPQLTSGGGVTKHNQQWRIRKMRQISVEAMNQAAPAGRASARATLAVEPGGQGGPHA